MFKLLSIQRSFLLIFIFVVCHAKSLSKTYSPKPTVLQVPEDCKFLGICENVPYYPEAYISSVISELQNKSIYNNITFNQDPPTNTLSSVDLSFRFAEVMEDKPLCNSIKKDIYPQLAKDENDKWHVILNTRSARIQRFAVEICSNGTHATTNSSCSNIAHFIKTYEGICGQKFILRKMYAIHNETKAVYEGLFQVPTCCSCVAKYKNFSHDD